jgi:hypothetical protein
MYDESLPPAPPPAAAAYTSASWSLLARAATGDLVMAPTSLSHTALSITAAGAVTVSRLDVVAVTLAGRDLAAWLTSVETNRLFPACLYDFNFASGALAEAAFSRQLPVRLGGTGCALTAMNDGAFAVGRGVEPMAFPDALRWSDAGGLAIRGELRIAPDAEHPGNYFALSVVGGRLLLADALGTLSVDLSAPHLGVPPSLTLIELPPATTGAAVAVS